MAFSRSNSSAVMTPRSRGSASLAGIRAGSAPAHPQRRHLGVEIDAVQALDTRVVPWMLLTIAASARWPGGWRVLPHSGQPADSWVMSDDVVQD